MLFLKYLKL